MTLTRSEQEHTTSASVTTSWRVILQQNPAERHQEESETGARTLRHTENLRETLHPLTEETGLRKAFRGARGQKEFKNTRRRRRHPGGHKEAEGDGRKVRVHDPTVRKTDTDGDQIPEDHPDDPQNLDSKGVGHGGGSAMVWGSPAKHVTDGFMTSDLFRW